MSKLTLGSAYRQFVKTLSKSHDRDRAMEIAVGGQFDAVGQIEREILIHHGLQPDGYVIDVGCGSGRLAKPLAQYLKGPYLGIDVYPNWSSTRGGSRPGPTGASKSRQGSKFLKQTIVPMWSVSFRCSPTFSTSTPYLYLTEAKRVAKPGGRIIFSFLEFAMPSHWNIFEGTVAGEHQHPNIFMSRDGIQAWASHLDLDVVAIADGEKPQVLLRQPVTFEDGSVATDTASLGQSLCVLKKR